MMGYLPPHRPWTAAARAGALAPAARLPRARQTGSALAVVIVLLIVISLLGIGSSQISLLGEKTSRYDRDHQIAFQAAEAALMDAEFDIRGPNDSPASRRDLFGSDSAIGFVPGCGTSGTSRGLCLAAGQNQRPVWATVNFDGAGSTAPTVEFGEFTGRAFDAGNTGIRPARAPRYIVELVTDPQAGRDAGKPSFAYRVTAVGFGPTQATQVALQMIFRKE